MSDYIPKGLANLISLSDTDIRQDTKKYNDEVLSVIPKSESIEKKRERLFDKDNDTININLSGIPFWIWDEHFHKIQYEITGGKCCFVDLVGRPINPKTGQSNPMFPYEQEIFFSLFNDKFMNPNNDSRRYKHLWIKKAAGAGITELFIYLMPWLPMAFPKQYENSQMAIITGVRTSKAIEIMKRLKQKLLQGFHIPLRMFNERVLQINGCIIEAYPATNPWSYHGLTNLKFGFNDEADKFPKSIIDDVMNGNERYWGKSNPYTIFNSTAYEPDGLMERIEKQPIEDCNYKRIYILMDKLLGYIYSDEDDERAKASPHYRREYWGEYKGEKGNLFPINYLQYANYETDILEVRNFDGTVIRTIHRSENETHIDDIVSNFRYLGLAYETSIGCDPAYNSSKFAFIANKKVNGIVYAVGEFELQSPGIEEATELSKDLIYKDYPTYHPKIWVDASSIPFIRALKKEIGEEVDYHRYKEKDLLYQMMDSTGMIVCPIPFNKYGDRMLYHWRRLLELGLYRVSERITPQLYASLNSAKYSEDNNKFDKKGTIYNDTLDAGRLANCNWNIGNTGILFV